MDLPYVDEHTQHIAAPADEIWSALSNVLRRVTGSSAWFARLLGCDPAEATADFELRPGAAVPGFRVVEADPRRRLALQGRHRFSTYALTFVIDGDRLRAQTHAAFPGVLGRLYRAAVIGTGFHRLATRRLLRQVARALWRAKTHGAAIVDQGAPLGKTKRAGTDGISDITNNMTGYGEPSALHDLPGDSIEIMERLPMPPDARRS